MSSYIHSPKHFNSIEASLINEFNKNSFILNYKYHCDSAPVEVHKKIKKFINELKQINVLAVSLQYAHHYGDGLNTEIADQMQIIKEKSKNLVSLNKVDLLKALKSVNYQIEIEHIADVRELTDLEKEAMQFLEDAINSVAVAIVTNSAEYDNSKGWSF